MKPCKYNQDISQQYGTNICNQCKRSTCRSWRVTQVVLATSELATCYESSDIHQSARCKEESKVHPDENKLCNAAPTNTYQTEQISLYVQNLWLTCELIHQKREQENDFRLCSFDLHRPRFPFLHSMWLASRVTISQCWLVSLNKSEQPSSPGRVFAPYWSENRYTLCPFWSGIGYDFWGNCGITWTYLSFQFQMSRKEREIFYANSKWNWRIFLLGR